jgi:hypothetical protein
MTKKDYELIAGIIAQNQADFFEGEDGHSLLKILSHQLANELATDNPRFNRSTFLKACGVSN